MEYLNIAFHLQSLQNISPPMLYNTSLSLSYIQYFVPSTAHSYIPSHPVSPLVTTSLSSVFVSLLLYPYIH